MINWKHAEAACNSRLIELGYDTFIPFNGGGEIDLIATKDNEIYRIQIKGVTPIDNCLRAEFTRNSVNFHKSIKSKYKYIDWFLIYDGENIYKITSIELGTRTHISLRYEETRQKKLINMASNYIF